MLNKLIEEIPTIYLVYGPTDFRKQIHSLMNMVKTEYKMHFCFATEKGIV